ncbi:MAG: hypothetical protein HC893_09515 [Chloroflexaceae bacterium]|nr:hypothetical protein [Chloroflexaceae bacterium]
MPFARSKPDVFCWTAAPALRGNADNRHARMWPEYRTLKPTAYKVLGTLKEFIFDGETRQLDLVCLQARRAYRIAP